MAAAKKDPLSRYFKDMEEFNLSSGDESEDDTTVKTAIKQPQQISSDPPTKDTKIAMTKASVDAKSNCTNNTSNGKKLPSARECLSADNSPAFLQLGKQKEVDWDQCHRKVDGQTEVPTDYTSNAVPPPTSYDPVTDPGIKVVDEDGNRRKRVGDDLADQNTSTKAYKVHKDKTDEDNNT